MMFRGRKWTNAKLLAKLRGRRVQSLELYDTSADDDLLLALDVEKLTSFDLSSSLITDAGIKSLLRRCSLRSLFFRDAPLITDRSMVDICACESLRELYLAGTAVTNRGIVRVAKLPNLWSLDISRTTISDTGIARLASNQIHLISFNDSPLTGVGFSTWSVKEKVSFYTKNSSLHDEGFATACRSLSQLWNVAIENNNVTNTGLRALKGQSPTMIRINGSKIDRDGVMWLIKNTMVQSIETDPSQFSSAEAEKYENYRGR